LPNDAGQESGPDHQVVLAQRSIQHVNDSKRMLGRSVNARAVLLMPPVI